MWCAALAGEPQDGAPDAHGLGRRLWSLASRRPLWEVTARGVGGGGARRAPEATDGDSYWNALRKSQENLLDPRIPHHKPQS